MRIVHRFVEIQRDEFDGRPLGLIAEESIGSTDPILRMPLKLTMSQLTQRMVKTKRGRLTEYLKEIFQRDSEWGLATFLLHEVHRGEDSPWHVANKRSNSML